MFLQMSNENHSQLEQILKRTDVLTNDVPTKLQMTTTI